MRVTVKVRVKATFRVRVMVRVIWTLEWGSVGARRFRQL